MAKLYKAKANAVLILDESMHKTAFNEVARLAKPGNSGLEKLLFPIIKDGILDAKIISGSPDIHGQFKARARDSHLSAEVACFLGGICSGIKAPVSYLDTMVKSLEEEDCNMVVIGGPITNRIALELQKHLPARLEFESGQWAIKSSASGKTYSEENTGLIELVEHPFHKGKKILFIAGIRNGGTKAAVLALQANPELALSGNNSDGRIRTKIVEGLDMDSDGKIDSFEFRE